MLDEQSQAETSPFCPQQLDAFREALLSWRYSTGTDLAGAQLELKLGMTNWQTMALRLKTSPWTKQCTTVRFQHRYM